MTNMTNNTDDRRNRRRLAAILAGGLVVGVGTMATLASWNDVEYATSTYTAGVFNMQGSADGTTYADHLSTTANPSATLGFSTPVDHLSPTDVVYAPYAVRLAKDTSYTAKVTLAVSDSTGDIVSNLRYSVYETPSFGCAAATDLDTATLILDGDSGQTQTDFTLDKPAAGVDGTAVNLCFVVTASSSLVQDTAGQITWGMTAESIVS